MLFCSILPCDNEISVLVAIREHEGDDVTSCREAEHRCERHQDHRRGHHGSTASEAEIKKRIDALRGAGYTQFTIQLVPGQEQALGD